MDAAEFLLLQKETTKGCIVSFSSVPTTSNKVSSARECTAERGKEKIP